MTFSEGSYFLKKNNCAVIEKKSKLSSYPDKISFISVLQFSHSVMTQHIMHITLHQKVLQKIKLYIS